MLMLTRGIDEAIVVEADDPMQPAISMEILATDDRNVRLKFEAPDDAPILVRRDPAGNAIILRLGKTP